MSDHFSSASPQKVVESFASSSGRGGETSSPSTDNSSSANGGGRSAGPANSSGARGPHPSSFTAGSIFNAVVLKRGAVSSDATCSNFTNPISNPSPASAISSTRKGTVDGVTINSLCNIMGAGTLALPFAFHNASLVTSLGLLLWVGALSYHAAYALTIGCDAVGRYSYTECIVLNLMPVTIAERDAAEANGTDPLLTNKWRRILTIVIESVIVLSGFGTLVVYSRVIGDAVPSVFAAAGYGGLFKGLEDDSTAALLGSSSSPVTTMLTTMGPARKPPHQMGSLDSHYFFTAISARTLAGFADFFFSWLIPSIIFFFLSCAQSMEKLKWASIIGFGTIFYIVLIVVGYYFKSAVSEMTIEVGRGVRWFGMDWGIFGAISTFAIAFRYHFNVPYFYGELQQRFPDKMTRTMNVSMLIVVLCYVLTGLCGYLLFGSLVEGSHDKEDGHAAHSSGHAGGNIIDNYGEDDVLANIGRFGLLIHFAMSYPIISVCARRGMHRLYCLIFRGGGGAASTTPSQMRRVGANMATAATGTLPIVSASTLGGVAAMAATPTVASGGGTVSPQKNVSAPRRTAAAGGSPANSDDERGGGTIANTMGVAIATTGLSSTAPTRRNTASATNSPKTRSLSSLGAVLGTNGAAAAASRIELAPSSISIPQRQQQQRRADIDSDDDGVANAGDDRPSSVNGAPPTPSPPLEASKTAVMLEAALLVVVTSCVAHSIHGIGLVMELFGALFGVPTVMILPGLVGLRVFTAKNADQWFLAHLAPPLPPSPSPAPSAFARCVASIVAVLPPSLQSLIAGGSSSGRGRPMMRRAANASIDAGSDDGVALTMNYIPAAGAAAASQLPGTAGASSSSPAMTTIINVVAPPQARTNGSGLGTGLPISSSSGSLGQGNGSLGVTPPSTPMMPAGLGHSNAAVGASNALFGSAAARSSQHHSPHGGNSGGGMARIRQKIVVLRYCSWVLVVFGCISFVMGLLVSHHSG